MIKNILSLTILLITINIYSQAREYDESALIFSQEKLNGSARFLAMSGAFGALGGNLSAADINPAGMAVFNTNAASITLDVISNSNKAGFYNLTSTNKSSTLNFAQAGGLIIFNTDSNNWSKVALSINTTKTNNFEQLISIKGKTSFSNEAYFLDPDPTFDLYDNVETQYLFNSTYGDNTKTTFTIATKYNDVYNFGFSIISNTIDFNQDIIAKESSKDINNNTFDGILNQNLKVYGQGIGFNFGVLVMPIDNLRLGLSYQTPTWYSLTEEFNQDMTIDLSNATVTQPENADSIFDYELSTSGKLTGSLAYIFGKEGLISMDYSYKDYSKSKLNPSNEFEVNNKQIQNNYTAVSSINIGGEYRLKYLSLRAGYHYENSPYKNASKSNNIKGYSFGFGFKTSDTAELDFAFNKTQYLDRAYYLAAPEQINLNNDIKKFTVSYTIKF